jgi:hypothetical protein
LPGGDGGANEQSQENQHPGNWRELFHGCPNRERDCVAYKEENDENQDDAHGQTSPENPALKSPLTVNKTRREWLRHWTDCR